jgi:hypothetical protein
VFPRWVGYFNVWAAISFVPGCILLMAWAAGRAALSDVDEMLTPAPELAGSIS